MQVKLRNNKDFLGGLLLVVFGAVGFYMALDYPFGSALRMGPGYFPRALSGIMVVFGLFIALRGLRVREKVEGVWGWKPLAIITVAFWIYGWSMDRIGFVPSLVILIILAAWAGHEFRLREVAILTVLLTVFAWAVFIYGLGLPYSLFWWTT